MTANTGAERSERRTNVQVEEESPGKGYAVVKNAGSSYFTVVDFGSREIVDRIGDGKYPHTALFHPDGYAYLLYISSAHLEVVDLDKMKTVERLDDLGTVTIGSEFTENGEMLFIGTAVDLPGSEEPGVIAIEIEDGVPRKVNERPLARCSGMRIGHDGRLYVGQKEEGEVVALSAGPELEVQESYNVGSKPHGVYCVPDTQLLVTNNAGESYASFIDTASGEVFDVDTGENPHGIAFGYSGDARRAVFPSREDDRVAVVDVDQVGMDGDATEGLVDVGTSTGFAAASPDGRYAVLDSYDGPEITLVDLEELETVGRVEVGGEPLHLVMSPGGEECYVGNMEAEYVTVVDTSPLSEGRPGDVGVVDRIEGVGSKPSGIFTPD